MLLGFNIWALPLETVKKVEAFLKNSDNFVAVSQLKIVGGLYVLLRLLRLLKLCALHWFLNTSSSS